MKSLNIKLLLPDSAYGLMVERAKAEGVDQAHYCSSLIAESLDNSSKSEVRSPFQMSNKSVSHANGASSKLPDTIEQILLICRFVWQDKMEYADAVRKIAKDLNVRDTTVRDKCTRRISFPHTQIDTDRFLAMLANRTELRGLFVPQVSEALARNRPALWGVNIGGVAMIASERDGNGRLRVPVFVRLIREFVAKFSSYNPDAFKVYIEGLGVLSLADWDRESNGYAKWKHRVDRAAQRVFTGI